MSHPSSPLASPRGGAPRHASPPIVLTFAASDPTGAGGLQADLLTLASLGCHPLSVLTAVAVQDSAALDALQPVSPEWIDDQARTLLEDMSVGAFKVGRLGSVENAALVAEILADYPDIPVVLDPVALAPAPVGSGDGPRLADDLSEAWGDSWEAQWDGELESDRALAAAVAELLLPQATVVTPNRLEARLLAGDLPARGGEDQDDAGDDVEGDDSVAADPADDDAAPAAELARTLIERGCSHVLFTGVHTPSPDVVNRLYDETGLVHTYRWKRLAGPFNGAGATLSAAIAANLANGLTIQDAVREAQDYCWHALAAGFRAGMGRRVPDRFFWARGLAGDGRPS
ncbi:phosphomethylpyrimidine kinase [Oryzomicrobium terrae]|uniref:hydroxymethylpyrimidine kinase n=1 Tax=Oryzomicrobium terrae TaxID=1735038 RepID=A0A5C1EC33_9RHOO|nr:hydroxymethylpyrimidine/phosphomethylpyrimidine kinase [Oryzomicrobium terrae]QEL66453.1 phosphomethylpyrimidine kinase [Oryzomicrobium terrae]